MSEQPQHDDLEKTQALVDQARTEAQIRVAEIDKEEARGAARASVDDEAAAAPPSGEDTEDEDADPVGQPVGA